jgi:hypothetical protein
MAIAVFSVGRDTQLVVIGPSGTINLSHVTAFESRQVTQSVRVNRLDGSQMGMELPKGWEGSFELERGDSIVEDFIAATEQNYFNGSISTTSTMYQYVSEVDESTSTYEYESVVFRLSNAGLWKGDAAVKQKLEFYGSRRKRI